MRNFAVQYQSLLYKNSCIFNKVKNVYAKKYLCYHFYVQNSEKTNFYFLYKKQINVQISIFLNMVKLITK